MGNERGIKDNACLFTSIMVDRGENTGRNSGLEYIGIMSSAANMLSLDVFEIF